MYTRSSSEPSLRLIYVYHSFWFLTFLQIIFDKYEECVRTVWVTDDVQQWFV